MEASDRIRAPTRANVGRMLAEADSASSTPEFLIRRNLILRKRTTSDSEERPAAPPHSNEAFKADGSRKKGVHPGHASLRGSRDVEVSVASHSVAPPWNGQLRTSSAKTHDVAGSSSSGGTSTTLGLTNIMGEESCTEHVRADEPRHLLTKAANNDTDPQEFRYGPGFVDKLKSRFISLSLQEKGKTQKSMEGSTTIRRYSSLENVLEQDDYMDCAKRKRPAACTNGRVPGYFAPPRNSFKRAKSMETLLLQSEDNMRHKNISNSAFTNNNNINTHRRPMSACDPLPGSVLINENLVIIEALQPKDSELNSKINKKKGPARQVSVSSINDEELPKPDIVKTCKLIFETASKRPVANSSVRKAPVLRQSAKIQKGTSTQQPQTNNNLLLGKVLQPPSNIPQPNANLVSAAQQKFGAKEVSCVVNGDVPSRPPKDPTSPESEVKTISNDALGRIRSQGSTVTYNGCQKGKPSAHTPKSLHAVKPSSPPPPPPVAKAVEKPVVNRIPSSSETESKQPEPTQNVEPVKLVSLTPNGLPPPPPPPPLPPPASVGSESERVMKTASKVLSIEDIKPADEDQPDEDSDDSQEEFLKPTALLGRSKPGGLWQKTPPTSNTVVYDFRGKEVKSHLPTNPAPFGCKPVKITKKQVKGATIVNDLDPAGTTLILGDFGESRDYDEDYDSDEMDIGAHLPAISGITFVGENSKCSKSSLLTTRNKKLKIRFVEKTTTHEYPAAPSDDPEPSWSPQEDASLIHHLTNGDAGPVGAPDGALPPPPPEDDQDNSSRHHQMAPLLRQNMAVNSSGGLSNYTPSMLSKSSESFQLGVERLVPEVNGDVQDNASSSGSAQEANGADSSSSDPSSKTADEELKPGDPADMSSWSSSTSTSDLLF